MMTPIALKAPKSLNISIFEKTSEPKPAMVVRAAIQTAAPVEVIAL